MAKRHNRQLPAVGWMARLKMVEPLHRASPSQTILQEEEGGGVFGCHGGKWEEEVYLFFFSED